jgi:hypothetical protein
MKLFGIEIKKSTDCAESRCGSGCKTCVAALALAREALLVVERSSERNTDEIVAQNQSLHDRVMSLTAPQALSQVSNVRIADASMLRDTAQMFRELAKPQTEQSPLGDELAQEIPGTQVG